jgi:predicted flap endonuclease-1-like 5' DNA nuclease
VAGAVVTAEVIEHGKGKKVINFKYKAKVRYRRKRGHRQGYTRLSVTSISLNGKTATANRAARRAVTEEPAPGADAEAKTIAAAEVAPQASTTAPRRRRSAAASEEAETPVAETPEVETPEANSADAVPARASSTRLLDIEGIGEAHAKTLADAGLSNTDDLLEAAGSASGRNALATKTGLDASQILDWVNRADLMRINGVGSEFSDLLEASGVDTVKELATRNAENLQARMSEVNEEKKLTRRDPNLAEVERWVSEAKTLPPMVSH